MPVFVHYCDKCGVRIEPEDVEAGNAVILDDGQAFCPKCAPVVKRTAAKKNAVEEKRKAPESKRTPVQRKRTTRVAPVKRKTTTSIRKGRRAQVDEYEQADREAPAGYAVKKGSPLPIILGVAGVVIVIIIIALAAGGSGEGGDRGPERVTVDDRNDRPPPPPPDDYGMRGNDFGNTGRDSIPRESSALKTYREILEFARVNPNDYAGIVERLENLSRSSSISPELLNRIQISLSEWMGKWDVEIKKDWDETAKRADENVQRDNYDLAAKLWDEFAQRHSRHVAYKEQAEAEAARLRRIVEVIEKMKSLDDDIAAAKAGFTVETLDKARKVLDKICEFGRKHSDIDIVVKTLGPVVIDLRDEISRLEDEEWARQLGR